MRFMCTLENMYSASVGQNILYICQLTKFIEYCYSCLFVCLFLCLSGSFQMSQLFTLDGQSIGVTASTSTNYLENMCVLLVQLCPTHCDPMDCSLPGSSVHGILQARILAWAAMPSSRGSSQPRDRTCISYVSCIGWWILSLVT